MEERPDDLGDSGKGETVSPTIDMIQDSLGQSSTGPMTKLPINEMEPDEEFESIPNPELEDKTLDIGDNINEETTVSSVGIKEEFPRQMSSISTNEFPMEHVPVIISVTPLGNDMLGNITTEDILENGTPDKNDEVVPDETEQTDKAQNLQPLGLLNISNNNSEVVESGHLSRDNDRETDDDLESVSGLSNNIIPLKTLTLTSQQEDYQNETVSISSNASVLILSAAQLGSITRRRTTPRNIDGYDNEDAERNRHHDDDNPLKKKPHYERRKFFNIAKHSISIVFIVIDLLMDWIMYAEMNDRGTYAIVAERRRRNVEFTVECEGTGGEVQLVYLVFTIIGTLLAVLQILNIVYQIYYEVKGVYYSKRLLHEVVETFIFLFFIEISQILLIMGFYDVCTLDCVINATKVRIVMNALFSFIKISWRFFTKWKCCTFRWVVPKTRSRVNHPVRPPSTPSSYMEAESRWNCEQSCKCCILRCCPGERDEACECTCGQCMRCEQMCGCCMLRCFPSKLIPPNPDICTCRCADCLSCEQPCKCFTFRCFPTHLIPPQDDICICRCGECLSCEQPCKCFTFRCFPGHLVPPHPDICTCRCTECLSCEIPCKCCLIRCFPEHLGSSSWWDCTFGDCMACEQSCCCCILRCFPSHIGETEACTCIFRQCMACERSCGCFICRCFPTELDPSKPDIFECTCGQCMACEQEVCCCKLRCCPTHLSPPELQWCECICCNDNRIVPIVTPPTPPPPRIPIVIQPVPPPPPRIPIVIQPVPPPPSPQHNQFIIRRPTSTPRPCPPPKNFTCCDCLPSCTECKKYCLKFIRVLIGIMIIIILFLFAWYLFLETVQIRFVLVCVANDTLMNTIQESFVQNYLKIYNI